jgi:hypothetical protein
MYYDPSCGTTSLDELSQNLLDSLCSSAVDKQTVRRRSHLFVVQASMYGEEYVVVWESVSDDGDYVTRTSIAVRRSKGRDGSVLEQLLGTALFVSFPTELGQTELTGPFSDEIDFREMVEHATDNAVSFTVDERGLSYRRRELFWNADVKLVVSETFSPACTEIRQIALTTVKYLSPEVERLHIESILALGAVNLAMMESIVEDRGGVAFNMVSTSASFLISPRSMNMAGMNGTRGMRKRADGTLVSDLLPSVNGGQLLSAPHQYCSSNLMIARERVKSCPIVAEDYSQVLSRNHSAEQVNLFDA